MAKKQSFGDKTSKSQGKGDWKYVKFVKSVQSEKTNQYRFNEQMIRLEGGETLDSALKRMNELKTAQDIEMPTFDEPEEITTSEEKHESIAEAEEDTSDKSSA